MPCKACHKPKVVFTQGRVYNIDGDRAILARVDADRFNFISLRDGNRWFDAFELEDTTPNFNGHKIVEEKAHANS